jgi:hypothetical protein
MSDAIELTSVSQFPTLPILMINTDECGFAKLEKNLGALQQMAMAIHQVHHAQDLFCASVVFKGVAFMVFDDLSLHVIQEETLIWSLGDLMMMRDIQNERFLIILL